MTVTRLTAATALFALFALTASAQDSTTPSSVSGLPNFKSVGEAFEFLAAQAQASAGEKRSVVVVIPINGVPTQCAFSTALDRTGNFTGEWSCEGSEAN
jgi:hypothetical protein